MAAVVLAFVLLQVATMCGRPTIFGSAVQLQMAQVAAAMPTATGWSNKRSTGSLTRRTSCISCISLMVAANAFVHAACRMLGDDVPELLTTKELRQTSAVTASKMIERRRNAGKSL